MVHGEAWTIKELFVYPNEYIYWSIQIVVYPFMTGLVAGAFVLSSLYHVFEVKQLKDIARFSLVFSFSLLPAAMMPLMLHLQQPARGFEVLWTPHFTSAISAFGFVFSAYAMIVASELWFVYRKYLVETALALRAKRTLWDRVKHGLFHLLTLGAYDLSEQAMEKDHKAIRFLAGLGIPVAAFLHGYAGFIFGSVKANALWMTPLMPVIFICSAIVSGIALCILTYVVTTNLYNWVARMRNTRSATAREELRTIETNVIVATSRYLVIFLVLAISLEFLDLIFRGYTAVRSWDVLRRVIYDRDFINIFIVQYGIGNLIPLILLLWPRPTIRRIAFATMLVLVGVFMMRWNVVIGGQAFSSSLSGFMHYQLPIFPHDLETYKEGLFGALTVIATPFALFYLLAQIFPVFDRQGNGRATSSD